MTDITSTLDRVISAVERLRSYNGDHVAYQEAIDGLHELEDAMTTDTTDEAQWWWIEHHGGKGWSVSPTRERLTLVTLQKLQDHPWLHAARVKCPPNATDHDIYQAAVDAWADAGFAHAPKEPPGPRSVEVERWGLLNKEYALSPETMVSMYAERDQAERVCSTDCRVVKVVATISEVTE